MTGKIAYVFCLILLLFVSNCPVSAQQKTVSENSDRSHRNKPLKTIIVDNYHPYTFLNDKGEPDGFSVEIARVVTKAMDLELDIRADKWDQAVKELEAGSIDLLPMMAYSPERDKIFDFSVPHTISYDAIFRKKGNTGIRSLTDLIGKTVIVMNKDAAHNYLLSSGLYKKMNLNLVDSLPEALKELAAGKGDAAIMPKLVGIAALKKLNIKDIDSSPLLIDAYNRPFSFAVKEGNRALLERLNQGLNIIKRTGQYDAIYKKWFDLMEDPQLYRHTVIKYGSGLALLLLGFIVWNIALRRQVKARTEHLEAEITQRKSIEVALAASKKLLFDIADNSVALIYALDPEGRFLLVNRSLESLYGMSREDLIGKTRDAIMPPEIATQHRENDLKVMNDLKPIVIEEENNGSDGKHTYLSVKFPLIDPQGQVQGVAGISTDITARKRADEALQRMQVLFNETGRIAKTGGWEFDAKTLELLWTEEVYHIHEVDMSYKPTVNEAIAFYAPTSRPIIEQAVQNAIKYGEPFDLELEIITAKNSHRLVHAKGQTKQEHGKTNKVFGVFQDITELKKAEEELRLLTQRLKLATQSARLGIWDWDVINNNMTWDDRMLELYGMTLETFPGGIEAWQNGLHPEDRDKTVNRH